MMTTFMKQAVAGDSTYHAGAPSPQQMKNLYLLNDEVDTQVMAGGERAWRRAESAKFADLFLAATRMALKGDKVKDARNTVVAKGSAVVDKDIEAYHQKLRIAIHKNINNELRVQENAGNHLYPDTRYRLRAEIDNAFNRYVGNEAFSVKAKKTARENTVLSPVAESPAVAPVAVAAVQPVQVASKPNKVADAAMAQRHDMAAQAAMRKALQAEHMQELTPQMPRYKTALMLGALKALNQALPKAMGYDERQGYVDALYNKISENTDAAKKSVTASAQVAQEKPVQAVQPESIDVAIAVRMAELKGTSRTSQYKLESDQLSTRPATTSTDIKQAFASNKVNMLKRVANAVVDPLIFGFALLRTVTNYTPALKDHKPSGERLVSRLRSAKLSFNL